MLTDGGGTNGGGAKDNGQRMSEPLIAALNHPLRRRLLRALHSAGDARSPIQLSKIIGANVSNVDYHVKVLESLGAVAKTGDRQVRGARENFFASKVSGHEQMVAILADTARDDEGAALP